MKSKYQVLVWAYQDPDGHESPGFVQDFETLKEAKVKARHYLTDEYMNTCEASQPYSYSQVVRGADVLEEYFGKQ